MDARRFDALTRALSASSRRGLLVTLLALPVVGSLLALLGVDDADAKGRRKRRKKRHKHGKGNGRHRKGKRRKKCRRKSRAKICRGKCGIVKNRKTCKKKIDCGACGPCGDVCASGCPFTSVQEAIEAAQAGDTIRLCAETYQEPATIIIDKRLTLIGVGDGEDGTILDGQEQDTVVAVSSLASGVQLENLRITKGGNTPRGGGLTNGGQVTVIGCTVIGNAAAFANGSGGGFFNDTGGEVTLIGCTVSGNSADGDSGTGGGIHNRGEVSLTDSTVSGNTAAVGGGIFNVAGGKVSLIDSTVSGNTAAGDGGGILNAPGGSEVILDSASHVCGNDPNQCVGFTAPPGVCVDVCPS